jgi:hypothetical protein
LNFDCALLAEAHKLSGQSTQKETIEQALRLLIRLRDQKQVDRAFGKYCWRGDLAKSRRGHR